MRITKRDGKLEEFDMSKIVRAIAKAMIAVDQLDYDKAHLIAGEIAKGFEDLMSVERVQDVVEESLMGEFPEVAKAYIVYRDRHAQLRERHPDPTAMEEYIFHSKYSQPGESWVESCNRVLNMHARKYGFVPQMNMVSDLMANKVVVGSMRSLQFGGPSLERNHARMYNCSFSLCDRVRFFQEAFWLLLSGSGVGYSVQTQHVGQLPVLQGFNNSRLRHFHVQDTIEGWADALGAMIDSAVKGYYVEYDYSRIRPAGSSLSSGGKAPGHRPLKKLLEDLRVLLANVQGRRLRTIECHDMMCHIANAVLAGGIRRSSLMALFSPDDSEMLYAKHPWNFAHGSLNSQRAMANNSAVLLRSKTSKDLFYKVIQVCKDNYNGEPGFFFTDNLDWGTNPCGEITLNPVINGVTGFAFCNLTEINAKRCPTEVVFQDAVRAATILGTLQAGYTDFKYLTKASREIAERDALLGVSVTGICDNLDVVGWMHEGAKLALAVNEEVSRNIGIRKAARITTVKPSGTASLVLGCASGVHPHHAKRYFRRVTANPLEGPAQEFKVMNPHMVETKPNGDWCITFPTETDGLTLEEMSGVELFRMASQVMKEWVKPGSREYHHNVSLTVTYHVDEWDDLIAEVWETQPTAVSFIQMASDKGIPFMPRERVLEEDVARWNHLIDHYKEVKYTTGRGDVAAACDGDFCDASSAGRVGEVPYDSV